MSPKYKAIPQPGYIIVEPIKSEAFNKSQLATLDNDKEHLSIGKVIAVSDESGVYENFVLPFVTDVIKDEIISYIQYSDNPIKLNGIELHVVRFDRVISKIVEDK